MQQQDLRFVFFQRFQLLGHDVTLNDIYYSHEIESIQAPEDCNTFCLKVASSNTVMMFSHPEATRIAQVCCDQTNVLPLVR